MPTAAASGSGEPLERSHYRDGRHCRVAAYLNIVLQGTPASGAALAGQRP